MVVGPKYMELFHWVEKKTKRRTMRMIQFGENVDVIDVNNGDDDDDDDGDDDDDDEERSHRSSVCHFVE